MKGESVLMIYGFGETKKTVEELKIFLEDLLKKKDKHVVIHYICTKCGKEQTTRRMELTDNMIYRIRHNEFVDLCFCKECDFLNSLLTIDDITEIEEVEPLTKEELINRFKNYAHACEQMFEIGYIGDRFTRFYFCNEEFIDLAKNFADEVIVTIDHDQGRKLLRYHVEFVIDKFVITTVLNKQWYDKLMSLMRDKVKIIKNNI